VKDFTQRRARYGFSDLRVAALINGMANGILGALSRIASSLQVKVIVRKFNS
jgi:hypothetical protein